VLLVGIAGELSDDADLQTGHGGRQSRRRQLAHRDSLGVRFARHAEFGVRGPVAAAEFMADSGDIDCPVESVAHARERQHGANLNGAQALKAHPSARRRKAGAQQRAVGQSLQFIRCKPAAVPQQIFLAARGAAQVRGAEIAVAAPARIRCRDVEQLLPGWIPGERPHTSGLGARVELGIELEHGRAEAEIRDRLARQ
jgi:hypothetical protein